MQNIRYFKKHVFVVNFEIFGFPSLLRIKLVSGVKIEGVWSGWRPTLPVVSGGPGAGQRAQVLSHIGGSQLRLGRWGSVPLTCG